MMGVLGNQCKISISWWGMKPREGRTHLEPTANPNGSRTHARPPAPTLSTHLVHLQGCRQQQLLHLFGGSLYLPAPPPGPVARPALKGHALHGARHDGCLQGHSPSLRDSLRSQSVSVDTYYAPAFKVTMVNRVDMVPPFWGSQD